MDLTVTSYVDVVCCKINVLAFEIKTVIKTNKIFKSPVYAVPDISVL